MSDGRQIALPAPPPAPTAARIALGLTGPAIPTREQLRFQLDHALARDAVHAHMDVAGMVQGIHDLQLQSIVLRSAAEDRRIYLRRPDLGRRLHPDSQQALVERKSTGTNNLDIVFVIADGLSALAVDRHAIPLLQALLPLIDGNSMVGPVCIVQEGRVAIGDEIGGILNAALLVLLIGERPGLSAPDSLGVYITWQPRPGRTDAERNCISNIRLEGLSYAEAAYRIAFYINEAKRLQATGVSLKDPPPQSALKG